MSELKVTSIEELKQASRGEIVELPPFSEGGRFVARLKRPSMLGLAKSGKIPNNLMVRANELFTGGEELDSENEDLMIQMFELFDLFCEQSFVEPKYSDIKEAGIELTDEQYMFVFNYSQRGVQALDRFHTEQEN